MSGRKPVRLWLVQWVLCGVLFAGWLAVCGLLPGLAQRLTALYAEMVRVLPLFSLDGIKRIVQQAAAMF